MKEFYINYDVTPFANNIDVNKNFEKEFEKMTIFLNEIIKLQENNINATIGIKYSRNVNSNKEYFYENLNVYNKDNNKIIKCRLFSYHENEKTITIKLGINANETTQGIIIDKEKSILYSITNSYCYRSFKINNLKEKESFDIEFNGYGVNKNVKNIDSYIKNNIYRTSFLKKQKYEIIEDNICTGINVENNKIIVTLNNCQFSNVIININELDKVYFKLNSAILSLISKNNVKTKTATIISKLKIMEETKDPEINNYILENIKDAMDLQKLVNDSFNLKIIPLNKIIDGVNSCLSGFYSFEMINEDKDLLFSKIISDIKNIEKKNNIINNNVLGDIELYDNKADVEENEFFNINKISEMIKNKKQEINIKLNYWKSDKNVKNKL